MTRASKSVTFDSPLWRSGACQVACCGAHWVAPRGGMVEVWLKVGRTAHWGKFRDGGRRIWGEAPFARGGRRGHDSGSPALISASRKHGGESIKPGWSACNNATESLGFNFSASANAAFASGALSAAA